MSESIFSEYASYYDLLYQDKDYVGEADYIASLIARFHSRTRTILELGSGTGKHALYLTRKGFRVHGVERSEEMVSQARALTQVSLQSLASASQDGPDFTRGDIRTVRIHRQFDVAISLFHVISYLTTNDDLLAAFRTAREHVKPGGLFVFDVWYGPAVLTNPPAVRIKRVADDLIEATRLAEPVHRPNANIVDVNYHVFIRSKKDGIVHEIKEEHQLRYMFLPELDYLLGEAGFKLLHSEEWMTGREPGCSTWGVCFVARSD